MKVIDLIEELQNFVRLYGEDLEVYIADTDRQGYLEEATSACSTSCTTNEGVIDGVVIL